MSVTVLPGTGRQSKLKGPIGQGQNSISSRSSGECVRGDTGISLLFPYWGMETFILLLICYVFFCSSFPFSYVLLLLTFLVGLMKV